ncbi:response regulator [Sciscionella sediminilitoris]|uniref:response regulator n=1 Tax=Sciscionella sediminilitoris TaxID=1445613 RepID=UPI0004DEEA39|nr:response regulator transcription factor [Sciscionella sp. SE31]
MSAPTVLLADDHRLFAEAVGIALVERGFTVVARAGTLAELGSALAAYGPDACLLDRHLADGDTLPALERLAAAHERTRILLLTADSDPSGVTTALRAGARGYLHKVCGIERLAAAIADVLAGRIVVELPAGTAPEPATGPSDPRRLARLLTRRERECLALLVDGLDTSAMAAKFGVGRTTVRSHVQSLLTKLGVHSRLEAVAIAVRYQLLEERGS